MLVRRWSSFWSQPLDANSRQLAVQVAFFLIIPVGVLLHETGHAVATWSVGGHVGGQAAGDEVDALEAAVRADPGAVAARLAQVRYYRDHREPKLAAAAIRAGLRTRPDDPDLLNALGVTLLSQGRFADATVPL